MKHLKPVIFLVCITATAALAVQAVSIRSLLGLDEEDSKTEETAPDNKGKEAEASAQPASRDWGKTSTGATPDKIDLALVKRLLANLKAQQNQALLADETAFTQFIRQEANNLSVLSAARANNLEQDTNTAFLIQRAAENTLRGIYLNKLINDKLPKGFPTAEQLQDYYEKNQDKFVILERIHIWQIFFPVTDDMDAKAVSALSKKANAIADDIRNNKIDFNSAAVKHSRHVASRANGGYMGLIKSVDLKPGIKNVVMELAQGKISKALTTDTGIHIVKRGAIVPARKINLDEDRAQVQNMLLNQVRAQLRQAIFEQAAKTYPVELSDNKIEEWRLRLKTNLDAPAKK